MMHKRIGKRNSERRGVAAVELAILLPLLLLMLLGAWEVGRMVEVQQLLMNAAREGGRQASTGVASVATIQADVVRYLTQNGISGVTTANVTVTNLTDGTRNDPTTCNQLDEWQVTVTIPFNSVRWVLLNQVTSTANLSASAQWYSMKDTPLTVNQTIPLY